MLNVCVWLTVRGHQHLVGLLEIVRNVQTVKFVPTSLAVLRVVMALAVVLLAPVVDLLHAAPILIVGASITADIAQVLIIVLPLALAIRICSVVGMIVV